MEWSNFTSVHDVCTTQLRWVCMWMLHMGTWELNELKSYPRCSEIPAGMKIMSSTSLWAMLPSPQTNDIQQKIKRCVDAQWMCGRISLRKSSRAKLQKGDVMWGGTAGHPQKIRVAGILKFNLVGRSIWNLRVTRITFMPCPLAPRFTQTALTCLAYIFIPTYIWIDVLAEDAFAGESLIKSGHVSLVWETSKTIVGKQIRGKSQSQSLVLGWRAKSG